MTAPAKAVIYVPTRGHIWHETVTRLEGTARLLGMAPPRYVLGNRAVSEVRHAIVTDFLARDEEVLLMVDDDVVPPGHFMALLDPITDGDVEINAAVVPIARPGTVFLPNVYKRDGKRWEIRHDVMWGVADEDRWPCGLAKADGVGTGCIAIHRKVLQRLKRPFDPIINEMGLWEVGEDVNFCLRAAKAGFKIGVDTNIWCEHMTSVHANATAIAYLQGLNEVLQDREDDEQAEGE